MHSSLSRARKVYAFEAIIVSRLVYGLCTAWLSVSERRRVDGFQIRCIRQTWNIKRAFLLRISNKSVLETAAQKPLSETLLHQQVLLYGKAAQSPHESILRGLVFCPGSLRPSADRYVRRVGRPRHEWAAQAQNTSCTVASGFLKLESMVTNASG